MVLVQYLVTLLPVPLRTPNGPLIPPIIDELSMLHQMNRVVLSV